MFNYVMVLASVIIGLGITHLLQGVGGIVQILLAYAVAGPSNPAFTDAVDRYRITSAGDWK